VNERGGRTNRLNRPGERKNEQREESRARRSVELDKDSVAEAVHRAICQCRQSDGYGQCLHYAAAGSVLLYRLTKQVYVPQVGTFQIHSDPDNEYAATCDAKRGGMRSGEFHAWVVGPIRDHRDATTCDVIDLSARHYRRAVEDFGFAWKREEMPYLWCKANAIPPWLRFVAVESETRKLCAMLGRLKDLGVLAKIYYHRLVLQRYGVWEDGP
jgi:hypothetical protein